jgi:hypothetical protein
LYEEIYRIGLRSVQVDVPELLSPFSSDIAQAIGEDIATQVVSCL